MPAGHVDSSSVSGRVRRVAVVVVCECVMARACVCVCVWGGGSSDGRCYVSVVVVMRKAVSRAKTVRGMPLTMHLRLGGRIQC
jgi:hypothetical protein